MAENQKRDFKVSIIGAGFVGASTAYALMLRNIATEIVLIDRNKSVSEAESLDIHCSLKEICNCSVVAGDYCDIKDSDVIVVTCGRGRKLNETRLDMVNDNVKIAKTVADEIKKYYTKGIVLIVSNPVDVITYKMIEWLNLPKGTVFGTGCSLDSMRFTNVISEYIGTQNFEKVDAMVIGEHGDSQVALWSTVNVDGMPIDSFCASKKITLDESIKQKLANDTRTMSTRIIEGKIRTNYGIATSISNIIDAIKNDKKQVLSTSIDLHGEYGLSDLALSVPCVIGKNGVEKIIIEELDLAEGQALEKSSKIIKNTL